MANASLASEAVRVALDWNAAPELRKAATTFLDELKSGDVQVLGATAFEISRQNQPLEVRHHGLKLLQHLVRIRWDELNSHDKQKISPMVMDMVQSFSTPLEPWSLKSQTAALAAEVARKEGPAVWKELLDRLFTTSRSSPVHAEMVAMVLRWLPEDVIVHNDDLEGEKRRALLAGLTQHLPEIMPFMYQILESHLALAMKEIQQSNIEVAKQHAAAVTAGLNALLAYADWVPVEMFSSFRIIEACCYLLSSLEFRLTSCEILRQLVSRKKPDDEEVTRPFNATMARVFEILSGAIDAYFQPGTLSESTGYAQCLCESLVALGLQNLQSITSDEQKLTMYLRQMVAFFQHPKFSLHARALPVWLAVFRDASTDTKSPAKPSGRVGVPDDVTAVLLGVAFEKLSRHGEINEDSDDTDYSQYRGRLIELVRTIACVHPSVTVRQMAQRLDATMASSVSPALLNLAHTMLEAVVAGIVMSPTFGLDTELSSIMQGVLQKLLAVEWADPELVELHAKCFVAFGPYLKQMPDVVFVVIQKLFQLLTSVPVVVKDNSNSGKVRVQICFSILRLAKASDSAFVPHMQFVANTMTELQQKGSLLRAEHNALGEALLVAAGDEQQSQVLEWLLGPFRERWTQMDWDVVRLVHIVSEAESGNEDVWYFYHSVGLFEKAIRRTTKSPNNPMAAHVTWIIPRLLQLLRSLHSLWSPSVLPSLPPSVRKAIAMGPLEQAAFLGEGSARSAEKEDGLRNWLKGIRDSGYNILGYGSARIGEPFFTELAAVAASSAECLLENLGSMEYRHFRLMIHSVIIPFVRNCPRAQWSTWLGHLLPAVLIHCHASLPVAWRSLLEGNVKTATLLAEGGSSGLKTEVIEERILREVTREVCNLLAVLASPELNQNQPEHKGILLFIMQYGDAASSAIQLAVQSLQWPDSDVVLKSAAFCMAVTSLAVSFNNAPLHEIVGRDMFTSVIQSLSHESHASVQAELLGLLREIFVGLSSVTTYPGQVLMTLPSVTQQEIAVFESSFSKTSSVKEQRQLLKNLLLAGGGDHLKALKPQRSSVITNVNSLINQEKKVHLVEEPGPIGLATLV